MSLLLPIFQGLIVLNSTISITYLSRLNSSNELYYVSLLPIFQGLIVLSSTITYVSRINSNWLDIAITYLDHSRLNSRKRLSPMFQGLTVLSSTVTYLSRLNSTK